MSAIFFSQNFGEYYISFFYFFKLCKDLNITFLFYNLRLLFFTGQEGSHSCARCGRSYMHKVTLKRHQTYECGIEPMFSCPHCPYRGKHRRHLKNHVALKHYHISLG